MGRFPSNQWSRVRPRALVLAIAAAMAVSVFASVALANNGTQRNNVMTMDGVAGTFAEGATAHVNLIAYYDDQDNPHWPTVYTIRYQIRDLMCTDRVKEASGRLMYAIWVSTPTFGTHRLQNFNTNCTSWQFSNDVWEVSGNIMGTMLHQPVTMFVTAEIDGGIVWPDGEVIMIGHLEPASTTTQPPTSTTAAP